MICKKCNDCKYPQYCQYGIITTGAILIYSTIRIIPTMFRYMKKKIFGNPVSNVQDPVVNQEEKYPNVVQPINKTIDQTTDETKTDVHDDLNSNTGDLENYSESSNSDDIDRLKEIGSQIELNIVKKNRRRLRSSLD